MPRVQPGRGAGRLDDAITFHYLRHTHASQLIATGWDVAAVARRLADSIATVLDTYAHEFDAARREDDSVRS